MNDRSDALLQTYGLSLAQARVLSTLHNANQPLALTELSERLGTGKSNVTQLIDRMEAEDLARRVRDSADRRSTLAVITDKGRERLLVGQQALEDANWVLGGLDESEREELVRHVQRLLLFVGDRAWVERVTGELGADVAQLGSANPSRRHDSS